MQDLHGKLQLALTKAAESDYKAGRSDQTKQNSLDMLEKKSAELLELEEKIDSFENTIINLT